MCRYLTGSLLILSVVGCALTEPTGVTNSSEAAMKTIRVAGAQIPITADIESNLAAINRAIDFAVAQKADILLTRSRLFFRDDLDAARKNLREARRLIEKHGYHRRDEELQDAEAVILRTELQ